MNKNGKKDFDKWMKVKKQIDKENKIRSIKEGDIWWSSIGENVGNEICGKGDAYTRPVLVFKKLNECNFLAVPLTSQKHKGSWYATFRFNDKTQTAIVSQIQIMSVARLKRKIGQLSKGDYKIVFEALLGLLTNKKYALVELTRGGREMSRKCIFDAIFSIARIFKKRKKNK